MTRITPGKKPTGLPAATTPTSAPGKTTAGRRAATPPLAAAATAPVTIGSATRIGGQATAGPSTTRPRTARTAAHVGRGVALIFATTICFATLDMLSKLVNRHLPLNEIVWGRYAFHGLALMLLMGPRLKLDLVRTAHPGMQVVRGLFLLLSSALFTSSLYFLPLAESSALSFVAPLLLTALSMPLLGERVRPAQWVAVAMGFAGVLVIVRPGGQLFSAAAILPLGCAVTYALFQVITRKYVGRDSAYTTHFWTALVCSIIMTCTLPIAWKTPEWWGWLALIAMGLIGGFGHYLLIRAYENAQPATLAPFSYVQLVWAALYSWLVFDHVPDGGTLLGMGIIVGSGLFALMIQRRTMRATEEGIAPD
jgi:drug/metabolite transporter (DMT)-like permease